MAKHTPRLFGATWFARTTVPQTLVSVYFPDASTGYAVGSENTVLKTTDGGETWEAISGDLSRESYALPSSVAAYPEAAKQQATRRAVVYSIAPSRLNVSVLWAGTDDGLIHRTADGGKTMGRWV